MCENLGWTEYSIFSLMEEQASSFEITFCVSNMLNRVKMKVDVMLLNQIALA